MSRERLSTNRGNTYLGPLALVSQKGADFQIFDNFDCKPSKGERKPSGSDPGCYVANKLQFGGRLQGQFPHVEADDYSKGK
jgi:hypothetical protein